MTSETLGKDISTVEITHVSAFGIWLLSGDKELFLAYEYFPWFKSASIDEILNVQETSLGHFYWPYLDVDLSTEIIEHPERFPLIALS
jgi:hypothetical protein